MPSLFDRLALSTLPYIPTALMRRLASRYIAGERLEDALAKLGELRGRGFPSIIDLLGEDVADEPQARAVVKTYQHIADAVHGAGLDAYISVKPTHVGLKLSEDLCFELYAAVAAHCRERGQFLRVEMEDHPTTDGTLRVFERLRQRFDNVGIVLQSRLFRTLDDIQKLAPGPLNVRLVKGIYLEPAAIAHTQPGPIRDNYVEMARRLLDRGAFCSFATHDDLMAKQLLAEVERRRIPKSGYEFQVLLGVREPIWEAWARAGHTVRVYVPYGPEWRPYSTRRLRKNPQLFRHVMKDTALFWRR
jgi:proline dehydrogenase